MLPRSGRRLPHQQVQHGHQHAGGHAAREAEHGQGAPCRRLLLWVGSASGQLQLLACRTRGLDVGGLRQPATGAGSMSAGLGACSSSGWRGVQRRPVLLLPWKPACDSQRLLPHLKQHGLKAWQQVLQGLAVRQLLRHRSSRTAPDNHPPALPVGPACKATPPCTAGAAGTLPRWLPRHWSAAPVCCRNGAASWHPAHCAETLAARCCWGRRRPPHLLLGCACRQRRTPQLQTPDPHAASAAAGLLPGWAMQRRQGAGMHGMAAFGGHPPRSTCRRFERSSTMLLMADSICSRCRCSSASLEYHLQHDGCSIARQRCQQMQARPWPAVAFFPRTLRRRRRMPDHRPRMHPTSTSRTPRRPQHPLPRRRRPSSDACSGCRDAWESRHDSRAAPATRAPSTGNTMPASSAVSCPPAPERRHVELLRHARGAQL